MRPDVDEARLRLVDHRCQAGGLGLEQRDLALDPLLRLEQVDPALARVGGLAQPFTVPFASRLVLQELADLGQREPGVVAQAADEGQPVEVRGVVQAVVALGTGGRFEQPHLLVVADGAGRQAGLGGDLVDPEETLGRGGRALGVGHLPPDDTTTLTFT